MDPVACGLLATTARSIWKAYIDISANDAGADELVPVYVQSRPGHDKVQDAPQADSPVSRADAAREWRANEGAQRTGHLCRRCLLLPLLVSSTS